MAYEGRSPINDVMRSVVLGAAMIPPAALVASCAGATPTPPPPPVDPNGLQVATDDAGAPPNNVVRPRGNDPNNMPTRGFRGAPRGRG